MTLRHALDLGRRDFPTLFSWTWGGPYAEEVVEQTFYSLEHCVLAPRIDPFVLDRREVIPSGPA